MSNKAQKSTDPRWEEAAKAMEARKNAVVKQIESGKKPHEVDVEGFQLVQRVSVSKA